MVAAASGLNEWVWSKDLCFSNRKVKRRESLANQLMLCQSNSLWWVWCFWWTELMCHDQNVFLTSMSMLILKIVCNLSLSIKRRRQSDRNQGTTTNKNHEHRSWQWLEWQRTPHLICSSSKMKSESACWSAAKLPLANLTVFEEEPMPPFCCSQSHFLNFSHQMWWVADLWCETQAFFLFLHLSCQWKTLLSQVMVSYVLVNFKGTVNSRQPHRSGAAWGVEDDVVLLMG